MYRTAIEKMKKWKDSRFRKPLIIEGARQVGKTWLMKEFGRQFYQQTVYVNFDSNKQMKDLFMSSLDIEKIIMGLEIYSDMSISPENTLIIFDEVQEVPEALKSLKYFYENAPQYHIMCAGSLLGIALHNGTSFPVGKVDFLRLYPLSFDEFLLGTGNENLYKLLHSKNYDLINSFSEQFSYFLKQYYYIGGMPEAVMRFSESKNFDEVREVQKRILQAYEQDFSKHAPKDIVPKIRMVWNSIPSQLAKENKKFIYGLVREGGRAKDFETAIMWLNDCGLIHKVSRITTPHLPLKAYEDLKAFKLFLLDVGLLNCMTGISKHILLDGNDIFKEFKGSVTEQYVFQQLRTVSDYGIYYYTNDRNSCEIDLLVDDGEKVIPVEVKAEENLRAKSLKTYREKYDPDVCVRTSMSNYRNENNGLINLPLYCITNWI
ncbi:MAG: ATP-binding protein [Bacteroidales bacterium]|nr:ATP-binding protein [Bacteroidales bacterium]